MVCRLEFRFRNYSHFRTTAQKSDGTRSSSFKTTAKQPSNSQAAAKQPSNSHQQKTDEGFNSKTGLNITSSSPKAVISKSIPKKPAANPDRKSRKPQFQVFVDNQN
ncbi:hypothetical protein LXL04_034990 [Taraxacum kok-saghyz]